MSPSPPKKNFIEDVNKGLEYLPFLQKNRSNNSLKPFNQMNQFNYKFIRLRFGLLIKTDEFSLQGFLEIMRINSENV